MTVGSPGGPEGRTPRPNAFGHVIELGQGVTTGSLHPAQRVARHLGYGRRMIGCGSQRTFTVSELSVTECCLSADVVREEPGEGAHGPVLEGFDGALVLAHHPCGLRHGEALEETECHALLLLRVEPPYGVEEGGVGEGLQDGVLG